VGKDNSLGLKDKYGRLQTEHNKPHDNCATLVIRGFTSCHKAYTPKIQKKLKHRVAALCFLY
jgi:hypothetical protein